VDSGEEGIHKQLFEYGFDGFWCAGLYHLHFCHRVLHLSALASLRSGVLLQMTQGTSLLFGDIPPDSLPAHSHRVVRPGSGKHRSARMGYTALHHPYLDWSIPCGHRVYDARLGGFYGSLPGKSRLHKTQSHAVLTHRSHRPVRVHHKVWHVRFASVRRTTTSLIIALLCLAPPIVAGKVQSCQRPPLCWGCRLVAKSNGVRV